MASTEGHLLKNIPLFAQLSDAERTELAALLQARSYQENQPVIWIGDPGADFYIVQQGSIVLSCPDESGNEMELATLRPGDFFGEISLLDGGPRTASARAGTAATLLSLGRDDFLQFLRTKPSAAIHIMTVIASRTRGMLDKLRGIQNVNEVDNRIRPLQQLVDHAAAIGASGWFLICNILFIVAWICAQTLLYEKPITFRDDPPTFFWLGFMITLEAILLTMFVLNSQKRQAERDRIRADLDYQVNVKAHLEVMQLHHKVDRLAAAIADGRRTGANAVAANPAPDGQGPQGVLDAAAPMGTEPGLLGP
jgi:CRP/FNR family transcriptional regulator, cyclic AMP receptor protein